MQHEIPPHAPDNPVCPLCELEVFPGDSVIFSHGEIVHIKCRVTNEGIGDSVAHLLRRNAGTEYCQSCVARLLHTTYEQAVKAVTMLRMSSRYRVRAMGTCSVCGNHWLTIKAEPPRAALVLAVDDDPEVLGMLTEFLRVRGYEALAARDAEEAFNLMAAAPPDVVLLDTGLPRIGGFSVLRRIHRLYPAIPVIMLTGSVDAEFIRDTVKLGAFHCIAKPFDDADLADAIEAAVASRA